MFARGNAPGKPADAQRIRIDNGERTRRARRRRRRRRSASRRLRETFHSASSVCLAISSTDSCLASSRPPTRLARDTRHLVLAFRHFPLLGGGSTTSGTCSGHVSRHVPRSRLDTRLTDRSRDSKRRREVVPCRERTVCERERERERETRSIPVG